MGPEEWLVVGREGATFRSWRVGRSDIWGVPGCQAAFAGTHWVTVWFYAVDKRSLQACFSQTLWKLFSSSWRLGWTLANVIQTKEKTLCIRRAKPKSWSRCPWAPESAGKNLNRSGLSIHLLSFTDWLAFHLSTEHQCNTHTHHVTGHQCNTHTHHVTSCGLSSAVILSQAPPSFEQLRYFEVRDKLAKGF